MTVIRHLLKSVVRKATTIPLANRVVDNLFRARYYLPFPPTHYYSPLPDLPSVKRNLSVGTSKASRQALTGIFRGSSNWRKTWHHTLARRNHCRILPRSRSTGMGRATGSVVRQLQMLDKAGRLHVVGMREHGRLSPLSEGNSKWNQKST
jgi:hypothetical protein